MQFMECVPSTELIIQKMQRTGLMSEDWKAYKVLRYTNDKIVHGSSVTLSSIILTSL